jgi:D-beta-D-heptose 7-phosphate kinase/D-beta-D-heptose 1-phosphate adenosyltransferase
MKPPTKSSRPASKSAAGTAPAIPWLTPSRERPVRVAVVGDVILDEYLEGQVNRISPEAPVAVHLVTRSYQVPGGAANAARNVQFAGGEGQLYSVIGTDEPGKQLAAILKKDKLDTSHLVTVDDRPTVRKTRITSASHQMMRVDWERVHPISAEVQEKILSGLKAAEFDALVVSDYGKGMLPINLLSNILALAASRGVPSVVDPKGRDFSKYLHATVITPNRMEACDALGLDPSDEIGGAELGRRLQRTYGLKNVLVTLGAKGMVLVPEGGGPEIELPAVAREVYDVSGAGDTVVAMMALGLGARAPLAEAMHLANTAAALVVGKWGTQPIQLQELEAALRMRPDPDRYVFSTQSKISSRETLRHLLKDKDSRSKRVVFTNGCFDLIHAGHVSYLEAARSLGDLLVVGVNTDESVSALKGPSRPYVPLDQRMKMLAGLSCVDYVVPFGEETPLELIKLLLPDILVKGADWAKEDIVGGKEVRAAGGSVDTIDYVQGLSTTNLVAKIRASKP